MTLIAPDPSKVNDLGRGPDPWTTCMNRPTLVVLPGGRPTEDDDWDDDERVFLTAAGAIASAGLERVSFVPALTDAVDWDAGIQLYVRASA